MVRTSGISFSVNCLPILSPFFPFLLSLSTYPPHINLKANPRHSIILSGYISVYIFSLKRTLKKPPPFLKILISYHKYLSEK